MIKVAPSILSADYMNLEKDIKLVDQAGAEELHIDVMDGTFVPSISYGPGFVKAIRQITDMYLDVHMMVQNPEHLIPAMAEAGADNIGVHVEATPHIHRALQLIKNAVKDAEVVINPGTPVEMIKPVLHMVDQVLVMTVNPGFGGQSFIESSVPKIARLRKMITDAGLDVDIQVDGGINDKTSKLVRAAGANILVAGSFVYGAKDIKAAIGALKE